MLIDRTKFFEGHRQQFGSLQQLQVDGLNFLLGKFEADTRWADIRHVAYSLATIRRETGVTRKVDGVPTSFMYQPIAEVGSISYLTKYFARPNLRRALGNTQLSDAWNFKGRGYVQITGRANYTKFAQLLEQALVDAPELALEPNIAFDIMTVGMFGGHFTGVGILRYINATETKYFYARKVINGLDHAGIIAADAVHLERILRAAQ